MKSPVTTIVMISAAVALPHAARAGFGSFLKNAAEQAATKTIVAPVEEAAPPATTDAASATPAAIPTVPKVAPVAAITRTPMPWVMAQDYHGYDNDDPVKQYLNKLGGAKNEDVVALDRQLRDRAAEDRKLVAAGGKDAAAAQKELDRYDSFLSALGDETLRFNFTGKIDPDSGDVTFTNYRLAVSNYSVWLTYFDADGKFRFTDSSGKKVYLPETDVNFAKLEANKLYYISVFCDRQTDREYIKTHTGALFCAQRLLEAVNNNSKDSIDFQPMPRKGALHAEYADEALAIARGTLSHSDAEEVIIDADDWQVDYELGNPVRRRFGYWVIKSAEAGRKAFRMQACQDHQGGGQYGKLKYYAVGGGQMYVK